MSAVAANIQYGGFVTIQNALTESLVKVPENHFMVLLNFCNKFKKVSNIFKTFVLGVLGKCGINFGMFLVLVVGGKL